MGSLNGNGAQEECPEGNPDQKNGSATPERTAERKPERTPERTIEDCWHRLRAEIRSRIHHEQFETWFRRAALLSCDGEAICLAVQNDFTRGWLTSRYMDVIEQSVIAVFGGRRRVQIEADPELAVLPPSNGSHLPPPQARAERTQSAEPSLPKRRLDVSSDIALNPTYCFGTCVVGPCNRFAHAAAQGVSRTPGTAYNPLFVHGGVGFGKTHLLQSLCFGILENFPETRILYLSCETFVNHFISALEKGDLDKFRTKYRNVDVLVVDDIQILSNKERTQEEFFHTFNTIFNVGKQIVMSSDSPPNEIPALQERLVSRFNWGLVTEIESPCFETRMAILKRKSKDRGDELPQDVASLLAENINTNIRDLEGAVNKLHGYSRLHGQPVTIDIAQHVLRDVFKPKRAQPTLEAIVRVVTSHFNVRVSDLQSRRRTNAIAYPRQIAMYLARKLTRHSLEEIGRYFGGRDHSTVLYAVEKLGKESNEDPRLRELFATLIGEIRRS
jgi:chromosomal replication initiator protein